MAFTPQLLESFECGVNPFPALDQTSGAVIDTVYAHTGTYAYQPNTAVNPAILWLPITGSPANPALGFWEYPLTDTSDFIHIYVECPGGELVGIRDDPVNGTVDAYVDGSKVADGIKALGTWAGVWHNVQLYVEFHETTGIIQAWIDGILVIDYTGDTIPTGATGTANRIKIETTDCNIDDLAIGAGGQPGDVSVEWIVPDADTAQADWTPSSGTDHYAVVDEIPASDSDYVATSTNGHADEYTLEDFVGTDKTIIGVDILARAKVIVATGEQLKVGVDSGGTDDTETHTLTTTFEPLRHCMALNPFDSAAWEDADIDALKARMESVI